MPRAHNSLMASLLLTLSLAGCGQAGLPALAGFVGTPSLAALADLPSIDRQIDAEKLQTTEWGTLVRELPSPGRAKPVTFMTYKALDNNLGSTLPEHLNILERGGSSANLNVLALTDDEGPKNTYCYYIRRDNDPKTITSPYAPADGRGDLNTGSAETVKRAVRWAYGAYPSRLRWLDINDHGGGYYGIAQDDRENSVIRLPELARAIEAGSGQPVDVLSFDACLMASVEVAYELRGAAKVMVASEDSSYALGMNYDKTLAAMDRQPTMDPAALGRDLVLRAQRDGKNKALYTISAIDLTHAAQLASSVDALAAALLAALPGEKPAIKLALGAVQPFYVAGPDKSDFNHRDLNEIVDQLRAHVDDPRVQAACLNVKTALFNRGGAILMARNAHEEQGVARGLSIYCPMDGALDPIYLDTSFARATRWPQFLAALK